LDEEMGVRSHNKKQINDFLIPKNEANSLLPVN